MSYETAIAGFRSSIQPTKNALTVSLCGNGRITVNFKGIKKRFDIISLENDGVIIDDYGHHPTEIRATFDSVKEYAASF